MSINLDNHSYTKVCKTVKDFLLEEHSVSLPHLPHTLGVKGLQMLQEAKDLLSTEALFIDRGIYFFSSIQEAVNTLFTALMINEIQETGKNQILLSEGEEALIVFASEKLKSLGCTIKTIPINNEGALDLKALKKAINPKTSFFSLSLANSLTGSVHPINEISAICKENSIKLHVDVSSSLGKVPCRFDADFISFSSHLIHGGQGACLGLRRKDFFSQSDATTIPLWSQDPKLAKSLALSATQALLFSNKMALDVPRLKKHFETKLLEQITDLEVLFSSNSLPNVSVIYFPKVQAESLLYRLNKRGVYASFGGGGSQPLFTQIEKSQLPSKYRYSSLSFSFSRYTTKLEMDKAVSVIVEEVNHLQSLSADL